MLIKIEIIILVIIIILSFIIGIVINVIDKKKKKENTNVEIDPTYEEEVNKALSKVVVTNEDLEEGKTIAKVNIPKVKEIEEQEMPTIIKSMPVIDNIHNKDGE